MLSVFLTSLFLSMCPPGYICQGVCNCAKNINSASVAINISFTVEPLRIISMNVEEVMPFSSIYRVTVAGLTTGGPDAVNIEEKYLVVDNRKFKDKPATELITCLFEDNKLNISTESPQVLVMNWDRREERKALASIRRRR